MITGRTEVYIDRIYILFVNLVDGGRTLLCVCLLPMMALEQYYCIQCFNRVKMVTYTFGSYEFSALFGVLY